MQRVQFSRSAGSTNQIITCTGLVPMERIARDNERDMDAQSTRFSFFFFLFSFDLIFAPCPVGPALGVLPCGFVSPTGAQPLPPGAFRRARSWIGRRFALALTWFGEANGKWTRCHGRRWVATGCPAPAVHLQGTARSRLGFVETWLTVLHEPPCPRSFPSLVEQLSIPGKPLADPSFRYRIGRIGTASLLHAPRPIPNADSPVWTRAVSNFPLVTCEDPQTIQYVQVWPIFLDFSSSATVLDPR